MPRTKKLPEIPQEMLDSAYPNGFNLRDEANAIVAFSFRNTSLENLHAGKPSEILKDDAYSRITEAEMKALMIEACEKVHQLLKLREDAPDEYRKFVQSYGLLYCRSWKREK